MSLIVYIGNICIGLSIGLSIFGIVLFLAARQLKSENTAWWGRGTVYFNFILMTIANMAMIYALLGNDFSVSYVAHVGSRETPRWISAISLWSSLEGSILLWGWVLATLSASCIYLNRDKHLQLMRGVGLVLLIVEVFFFFLLALPANPFLPVSPVPMNGPGPNPLLQNHWLMAVHPPALYIGYIGFTIPFAFAIATLLDKNLSDAWVTLTRRWSLFAWSILSIAIVLGGWWSYAVLGWGGYWAWDPVENASLMPWLTGTALIHSVMVQEKRKMFAGWNIILAVVTFLLTLLGTFLTRSGVLESVHSFTESHVGPYFLVFIVLILLASISLMLWRTPKILNPGKIENIFSLEVLFLFNNLLFVCFCFIVFLGTLYPLIVEAVSGDRISVGEPYFNQMSGPLTAMILLLLGVGLITPWKKGTNFISKAKAPALSAVFVTLTAFFLGVRNPWAVLMIPLASFVFFIMLFEFVRVSKVRGLKMFWDQPRRYGGFIAHLGVLMIIVAVVFSSVYEKDQEVVLKRGASESVGAYTLTLTELRGDETPQRFEVKAIIDVSKQGKKIATLTPQMNYYPSSREPIGSPAIRSTLFEDLYLTLINVEKDGSQASLRAIVTPAVIWIWIGGFVVMLGGLLPLVLRGRSEA